MNFFKCKKRKPFFCTFSVKTVSFILVTTAKSVSENSKEILLAEFHIRRVHCFNIILGPIMNINIKIKQEKWLRICFNAVLKTATLCMSGGMCCLLLELLGF
jgi:hypothetical protein